MKFLLILTVSLSTLLLAQVDWQNRLMLADSFEQAGNPAKAREILEPLYAQNQGNYQIFDALNRVYLSLKEYPLSVSLLTDRLKVNPTDLNSHGLLGKTYHMMGDEQKAFDTWNSAINNNPANSNSYRVMANFALERRSFDAAIQFLSAGKKGAEDKASFAYELANLYALTMRFEDAALEYCFIVNADPAHARLTEARIFSYISKPGALDKTISVFERCGNNNIAVVMVLSRLYYEKKDFKKALDMQIKIDEVQGNEGSELYNFAHQLFTEGDFDASAQVYSIILKKYPTSRLASGALLGFAKAGDAALRLKESAASGNWKNYRLPASAAPANGSPVLEAYAKVAAAYPNTEIANEAHLRMAKLKLELFNDPPAAESLLSVIVSRSPLSQFAPGAIRELAFIATLKGNTGEAESLYEQLLSNPRATQEDKNFGSLRLARINFYQGDFQKGRDILTPLLTDLKDNNANDAIELMMLMNTNMYDSVKLISFAEADFLAARRLFKEAADRFARLATDKELLILNDLARLRSAEMLAAINNYNEALLLLASAPQADIKNIYADKVLYLQARIYHFGLNDPVNALKLYEELLARFPGSLFNDDARDQIVILRNKLS